VIFHIVDHVWRYDGVCISESALLSRSMVILSKGKSARVGKNF
jgi:hypothetical protein